MAVFSLRYSIVLIAACLVQPSIQNTNYVDNKRNVGTEHANLCQLRGDSDLYGIGVRITFYIQWGVIILALIGGVEDQIKFTRRGFNLVAIALMVSPFTSASKGHFAALEIFILSTLIVSQSIYFVIPFGSLPNVRYLECQVAGVPLLARQEAKDNIFALDPLRTDPFGIAVLLLVDSAFLVSQPWLYFEEFELDNNPACEQIVWIFTSIPIGGRGWIIFLKVFSIVAVVAGSICALLAAWLLGLSFLGREIGEPKYWRNQWNPPASPSCQESDIPLCGCIPRQPPRSLFAKLKRLLRCAKNNTIRLVVAAIGSLFIVFVEMTIKLNHIDLRDAPLTSTSQLLPMLVAIFSAVSLAMDTFGRFLEERANRRGFRMGALLYKLRENLGKGQWDFKPCGCQYWWKASLFRLAHEQGVPCIV